MRELRTTIRILTILLIAAWASWFSILAYWSYHRPHQADSNLGYTYYVKTFISVVYVKRGEIWVNHVFEMSLLLLTILFLILIALLRRKRRESRLG
jgi:hypothetical protein